MRTPRGKMTRKIPSFKDFSQSNKLTLLPLMNCHTKDIRTTMNRRRREHNSLLLLVNYRLGLYGQLPMVTEPINRISSKTSTIYPALRTSIISKATTRLIGSTFRYINQILANFQLRASSPTELHLKPIMLPTEPNLRPTLLATAPPKPAQNHLKQPKSQKEQNASSKNFYDEKYKRGAGAPNQK